MVEPGFALGHYQIQFGQADKRDRSLDFSPVAVPVVPCIVVVGMDMLFIEKTRYAVVSRPPYRGVIACLLRIAHLADNRGAVGKHRRIFIPVKGYPGIEPRLAADIEVYYVRIAEPCRLEPL